MNQKMVEMELTHPSPNWKRIRRAIISRKKTEFVALIERAKASKKENDMKELHAIVQSVMKLRKQNSSVQEIMDPRIQVKSSMILINSETLFPKNISIF